MTVAKYTRPDNTTQSGSAYKANIDGAAQIFERGAGSMFAAHEQTVPVMTVRVDAGVILNGITLTEVAAQSTGTITAPVSNPRIDRIVVDVLTGAVSVIAGTEAASPSAPAITAGKLPVAQVLLQTSSTTITNAMLTDERTTNPGAALLPANNLFTGAGNTFQGRQNIAFAVGGTVNAITFSHAPAFTALVDMMEFGGRATGANTSTTPTVNPDGLGAITIQKGNGAALAAGDIEGSAHELMFRYNATSGKAVLLNPKAALSSFVINTTRDMTAASGNQAITGVGFTPKAVIAFAVVEITSASSWGMANAGNNGLSSADYSVAANPNNWTSGGSGKLINLVTTSGGTNQSANVASFDADGLTLAWTKAGLPTGTANVRILCLG